MCRRAACREKTPDRLRCRIGEFHTPARACSTSRAVEPARKPPRNIGEEQQIVAGTSAG